MYNNLRKLKVEGGGIGNAGQYRLGGRTVRAVWQQTLIVAAVALASCGTPTTKVKKESGYARPSARMDGAAAVMQGKVYYIGGVDRRGRAIAETESYDPQNDLWHKKKAMRSARSSMPAVAFDNQIYVMGGRSGDEILDVMEIYDPGSDTWTPGPAMSTARWRHMGAVYAGKLFAFGGIAGTGQARRVLKTVEVFDPRSKSWSPAAPMPEGRSGAAVAVLGSKIYLIGGKLGAGQGVQSTPTVQIYDAAVNKWTRGKSLPAGMVSGCAVVHSNQIWLLGGSRGAGTSDTVEVYSHANLAWRSAKSLSKPRAGHACAQIGDVAYIVGGLSRPTVSAMLSDAETYPLGQPTS